MGTLVIDWPTQKERSIDPSSVWRLSRVAVEGKSVCIVGGRGMLWPGMVMRFCGLPSVSDPIGTANAAMGARRAVENLRNNISSKG
jgi:hypothetical protein